MQHLIEVRQCFICFPLYHHQPIVACDGVNEGRWFHGHDLSVEQLCFVVLLLLGVLLSQHQVDGCVLWRLAMQFFESGDNLRFAPRLLKRTDVEPIGFVGPGMLGHGFLQVYAGSFRFTCRQVDFGKVQLNTIAGAGYQSLRLLVRIHRQFPLPGSQRCPGQSFQQLGFFDGHFFDGG